MTTTPAPQPFRRRSHDRILGGVCGAVADRTGIDVGIVRLIAVLLSRLRRRRDPRLPGRLAAPARGRPGPLTGRAHAVAMTRRRAGTRFDAGPVARLD